MHRLEPEMLETAVHLYYSVLPKFNPRLHHRLHPQDKENSSVRVGRLSELIGHRNHDFVKVGVVCTSGIIFLLDYQRAFVCFKR